MPKKQQANAVTTAVAVADWRRYEDLALTPVLTAALDAFQEHGYHGTTVRDISRRAGLTMPVLYYHHGNKEGILLDLLDVAMGDLLAHLEGGLAAAGDNPRERLANFVRAIVMHMTERRNLARLHPEYRFLGPESRLQYKTQRSHVFDLLLGVVEQGAAEGVFHVADARFTTRSLFGMLQGIPEWYAASGPSTPEQIAEQYVDNALRLVGSNAERASGKARARS